MQLPITGKHWESCLNLLLFLCFPIHDDKGPDSLILWSCLCRDLCSEYQPTGQTNHPAVSDNELCCFCLNLRTSQLLHYPGLCHIYSTAGPYRHFSLNASHMVVFFSPHLLKYPCFTPLQEQDLIQLSVN